ncbi:MULTISPECIES: calcium-binding protein [Asticcacaulis]|uniref:beta strand repeat-containing protein n=1 Tax=Asticcacaulis TaxID=76890 RepID=UPI001AE58D80|nr:MULTISPECIES: calcium-binding protein [Asticcacaulis]MBP2158785.1 Ca2+-binding RTX toxin-like protein [Asticcacaulis solisilvae]MDR6799831.1 Ca2+-binding RTX toxin-like protein [Asticcacaulis sp. BE141]
MVTAYTAGAVTTANTYVTSNQFDHKIVTHPGGGYTLIWQSSGQDGSGHGIYQQRFDNAGTKVGAETRVNTTTAGEQTTPTVARLDDGDYVVAWVSNGQDGPGAGIYAQRFNSDGTTQGSEFRVNTTTAGNQGLATTEPLLGLQISDLGANGFIVTWEGNGAQTGQVDSSGIFAQRYELSGAAAGGETRINTTTANAQTNQSVAAFSDGSYVITWASYLQDGSTWGVYAQRFNASGVAVGSERRINTYTTSDQGIPFVAVLNNDTYVITWSSYGQDGSDLGVYAQRFDSADNALGAEFRVNTYTAENQNYGRVTALADGGFVIGWTSKNQDVVSSLPYGTYMQRYDADGNTVGFETLVNTQLTGSQVHPVFAETENGNFVAAWVHYQSLGDVHQQVFTNTTVSGGAEKYYGTVAHETIDGGAGNDTIYAGGGNDTLWGSAGTDFISGDAGDDIVDGGADNDTLYGLDGADNLIGSGGNDTLYGGTGADTMTGGTGNDAFYIDHLGDVVVEAAGEGADTVYTSFSTDMNTLANIENLTLTATDTISADITGTAVANVIIGNSGANLITGGGGNDVLHGYIGADTLDGGVGDDTMIGLSQDDVYYVDSWYDVIQETLPAHGWDIVYSSVTYDLSDNIDELILTGTGNLVGHANKAANIMRGTSGDNTLYGNEGNDTLFGYEGADRLEGGTGDDDLDGGEGADTMVGGGGQDAYMVDNIGDVVIGGAGADHAYTYFSLVADANLDRITLLGTADINASGNAINNQLNGNSGNNILMGYGGDRDFLFGNGGNDYIDGGTGYDSMYGGLGDDTFVVDVTLVDLNDRTFEDPNGGTDLVYVHRGYTLEANVENLTQTGTANIHGYGNVLDNVILGNSGNSSLLGYDGNDWLDGGGGVDTLTGSTGNDTYGVDNIADLLTETAGQGIDRIRSSITWTLATNFENLTLTGADTINGTGNSVANDMVGNVAANVLTSHDGNDTVDGGGGVDTLIGGVGDDLYRVDNTGDIVTELAGEGNDTIEATASYSLAGVDNIEALNLTGSGNIDVTGNDNGNVLNGNSGNNILDGGAGADTLTGGLGDDTYIVDDAGDVFTEGSNAGTDTVVINASHALGANFENLTLTGAAALTGTGNSADNVLTGNDGDNTLNGGDGNDTLDGGLGSDSLSGGLGDDTYVIDNGSDVIVENAGEGTDMVRSHLSHTLAADFEHLTLLGSASDGTGNAGANAITGNASANTLDGAAGADTLNGGAGNDTYYVDDAGEVVVENASEGTDTIHASVSFNAAANVENVVLTGSGNISSTGNSQANTLTGNSGDNSLSGGGGNDTLIGGDGNDTLNGGGSSDSMIGGLGNDFYSVDSASDSVVEALGEGADTVSSSISYTATANIETVILSGSGNTSATGNALDNTLTGNGGNNSLSGGDGNDTLSGGNGQDSLDGGVGADSLSGGAGNDAYVVDDAGDVVVEIAGQGTDTVSAGIDYGLTAEVEHLILTGAALSGTGNSQANTIIGTAGNNSLSGGDGNDTLDGSAGADTLTGGGGDDSYVVDDAGDVVTEASGEGTDAVSASVDYALTANVENLILTGLAANGTGNALDNAITGTNGNNVLDGGAGADTLTGGDGDDSYVVDDAGDVVVEAASEGTDTVTASVDYSLTADVENIILTGGATNGTGNGLDNAITGTSGANILTGGVGDDSLTGGGDTDDFVFSDAAANGTDTITDFEQDTDRLVFTGADYGFAASHTLSASEFTIGTASVGTDAQFIWDDTTGQLYWDADGTGAGAAIDIALIVGSVTKDDLYFM